MLCKLKGRNKNNYGGLIQILSSMVCCECWLRYHMVIVVKLHHMLQNL